MGVFNNVKYLLYYIIIIKIKLLLIILLKIFIKEYNINITNTLDLVVDFNKKKIFVLINSFIMVIIKL